MNIEKTQVISIINFKGGVGKSTVTFNLGSELARKGYEVLIIDFDGQGNLTKFSGIRNVRSTIITGLNDVMDGTLTANSDDPIYNVHKNLDIMPCNIAKEKWMNDALSKIARETILKRYIDYLKEKYSYNYILIDNAPSVNIDFQNSLVASDQYLIVTEAEVASTDGVQTVLSIIGQIKQYFNPKLRSAGILINKCEERTRLHMAMKEDIGEQWGDSSYVYENCIPKSITAGESNAFGISISTYKSESKIAEAYRAFANEFISKTMEV